MVAWMHVRNLIDLLVGEFKQNPQKIKINRTDRFLIIIFYINKISG